MNKKRKLNISEFLKKRNVKRFSMFIVIAFVFLIFSKLSNDYKQTIKLKVDLVNTDEEIILQDDSLNTIDVFIEAKGFALVPFIFKDSKAIVLDAKTEVVTKPQYYVFDVQKHRFLIEDQLGSAYNVLSIQPDSLVLLYSKRASKYVPIVLQTDINFASGYDIFNGFTLDVDSAKVVGSTEKVSEIKSIATETLSLQAINLNIDRTINLTEPEGIEVFPKAINIKAEVKRFTEGTIEVPITITNKPDDVILNYFPKSVTISYYIDLDNYNAIKEADFRVECDYSAVENNQPYFIPKIAKQPKFVKRIGVKQKRIDFIKL
jgi:hypothetical protein